MTCGRLQILIVEDDADIRTLEERLLAPAGEVSAAATAAEAGALAAVLKFDVAVLDYNLGDERWRPADFAARLRSLGTRVVLCSAAIHTSLPIDAAAFDALIPKPFEHEEFLRLALGGACGLPARC